MVWESNNILLLASENSNKVFIRVFPCIFRNTITPNTIYYISLSNALRPMHLSSFKLSLLCVSLWILEYQEEPSIFDRNVSNLIFFLQFFLLFSLEYCILGLQLSFGNLELNWAVCSRACFVDCEVVWKYFEWSLSSGETLI